MNRVVVVVCLVGLTQVCAKAEEPQTSKAYAACLDKSGGVTSAMQACIADERERQDKRLNAAYKALIGAVSEERKTELRSVQRKWIAFRDANCAFYDDPKVDQQPDWPAVSASSPRPPYAPRSYKTSSHHNANVGDGGTAALISAFTSFAIVDTRSGPNKPYTLGEIRDIGKQIDQSLARVRGPWTGGSRPRAGMHFSRSTQSRSSSTTPPGRRLRISISRRSRSAPPTTANSHQLLISGKCKENSSARIKRVKLLFGTYFHPEVLAGPATGSRHHAQAEVRGEPPLATPPHLPFGEDRTWGRYSRARLSRYRHF